MKLYKIFTILFCLTGPVYCFKYEQLPITVPVPELHSPCFVIVSLEGGIVMHEKNSSYKINISQKYKKQSLHDIALSTDTFIASSSMSGITLVTNYKNTNGCNFRIVISGESSKKELNKDIEKIKLWLNQFLKKDIYAAGEIIGNMPVIYGKNNFTEMIATKQITIILSNQQKNIITKKIRYYSVIAAPVQCNRTFLGEIILKTPLFKNPISFKINASKSVKRGTKCKIFCDSVKYLIFGSRAS